MKTVLIPGSFDPVTMGHYDVIERASKLFDRVVVCIFHNAKKQGYYPIEKRIEYLKAAVSDLANVEIDVCDGLVADYVDTHSIDAVVKGVRNTTDFEYEWSMALTNRRLSQNVETIFLPAKPEYLHISSSLVRELMRYQKPISDFLPPNLRKNGL